MPAPITALALLYFLAGTLFFSMTLLVNKLSGSQVKTDSHHYFANSISPTASTRDRLEHAGIQGLAAFVMLLFWPCVAMWMVWKILSAVFVPTYIDNETSLFCETRFLVAQTTLADAENNGVIHDPAGLMPRQPFGYLFPAWLTFCAKAGLDCEVWSFTIPKDACYGPHFQIAQMDIHGYAIVENQKIMDEFLFEFH